jgi:hypothetical protein
MEKTRVHLKKMEISDGSGATILTVHMHRIQIKFPLTGERGQSTWLRPLLRLSQQETSCLACQVCALKLPILL